MAAAAAHALPEGATHTIPGLDLVHPRGMPAPPALSGFARGAPTSARLCGPSRAHKGAPTARLTLRCKLGRRCSAPDILNPEQLAAQPLMKLSSADEAEYQFDVHGLLPAGLVAVPTQQAESHRSPPRSGHWAPTSGVWTRAGARQPRGASVLPTSPGR
jgi:hypothetical protein